MQEVRFSFSVNQSFYVSKLAYSYLEKNRKHGWQSNISTLQFMVVLKGRKCFSTFWIFLFSGLGLEELGEIKIVRSLSSRMRQRKAFVLIGVLFVNKDW